MRILLTGGSASGKSTFAQKLALALPAPRCHISTAYPCEADTPLDRARSRDLQQASGFLRIQRHTDLECLVLPHRGTVILDCLCSLTANEMFGEDGAIRDAAEKILTGIGVLSAQCEHLIVVTNEIGSGGGHYTDATPQYIRALGALNAVMAQCFDCVCELVCGIPSVLKGQLPVQLPKPKGDHPMLLVIGGEASGKRAYAECLGYTQADMSCTPEDQKPVLYGLESLAAQLPAITPDLLSNLYRKKVILCTEVGSGVIPADADQRDARILTGKLCILLAQRASRVVHMVCGIPTILK